MLNLHVCISLTIFLTYVMFSFTMESQFDSTKTQHTPNLQLSEKKEFSNYKDKALVIG